MVSGDFTRSFVSVGSKGERNIDVPNRASGIFVNRFNDHAIFDAFRNVEHGERHGARYEDRSVCQMQAWEQFQLIH